MSWTVFSRIYTNLESKVFFQFCFQVRRPVISTIVDHICHFMRNKKSLPKYLIHENSKCQYFFISEKNSPKNGQSFQHFTLYSKGCHFSITKLDILIFSNILHLEIDFWQKSREKHYKWVIEKNGTIYTTADNLKTAYLWNFHFH